MEPIIDFFKNNYSWIFGGIGVAAISGLIHFFCKKSANNVSIKQKQRAGDNATNIQVGQINKKTK